jgi:hypothetical protein
MHMNPGVLEDLDPHPVAGLAPEAIMDGTKSSLWHQVFALVALFLVVFGLMNFAELPLGWKDRTEQISRYLAATVGLGPEWALPTLWAMKGLEALLGVAALIGLIRREARWVTASIVGWMAVMIGFAAMDVWAADRAELQEHTLYFAAFAQMLMVVIVLRAVGGIKAVWLRGQERR